MPSLNKPAQRLKVPTLPLELPRSGPVTHPGEISVTGKSHGKKLVFGFIIRIYHGAGSRERNIGVT